MVEKRWRVACEKEIKSSGDDKFKYNIAPYDSEFAAAFVDRKKRLILILEIRILLLLSIDCMKIQSL